MAKTENTGTAAVEGPMLPMMLVDLAQIYARTVLLAALTRPAASMTSDQAAQRETWSGGVAIRGGPSGGRGREE